MEFNQQLDLIKKESFGLALNQLEKHPLTRKILKKWLESTIRIEGIVPIALGLIYGIPTKTISHITAAIISSAYALRMINDSKDRSAESAFYNAGHPSLLFSASFQHILKAELAEETKTALLREFMATIDLIVRMEFQQEKQEISMDKYLSILEGKTVSAYVLIFTIFKLLDENFNTDYEYWERFAYHYGMSIQIRNDFNGCFVDDEFNDISANNLTLPIQMALAQKDIFSEKLETLLKQRPWWRRDIQIREVLEDAGIKKKLWTLIKNHISVAEQNLDMIKAKRDISFFYELFTNSVKDIDNLFLKNPMDKMKIIDNEEFSSKSLQLMHILRNTN